MKTLYFYNTMKDKVNKFLEIEDRVFRAPYNYLKEKGIIDKVIELKADLLKFMKKMNIFPMVEIKCSSVMTKPSFLRSTDSIH